MIAWPLPLPPFSNREDFLLPLAINDDETLAPINLAGVTRENPGPFASNNWLVTANGIATTSATLITIPDYPVGSQVSTLALTIGVGLNVPAGSPIIIYNGPRLGN